MINDEGLAGGATLDPSLPAGRRKRGRPGYDQKTLLAVAAEVFTSRGFDGTSMEDLGKRLGITKSAIYHHVSSKDELLGLALDRALDGLSEVVQGSRMLRAGAVVRLRYLIRGSVLVLIAEKPFVTLLLRVHGNTEVERRALERRREFDGYFADLVEAAIAEGAVRTDIRPATTARLLFGMVNSLVEWVRPQGDAAAEGLADAVWSVAWHGIAAEPDRVGEALS
jgi:AcrR family transcriptional regulator